MECTLCRFNSSSSLYVNNNNSEVVSGLRRMFNNTLNGSNGEVTGTDDMPEPQSDILPRWKDLLVKVFMGFTNQQFEQIDYFSDYAEIDNIHHLFVEIDLIRTGNSYNGDLFSGNFERYVSRNFPENSPFNQRRYRTILDLMENNHVLKAQLNGSNGEWTGSDDVIIKQVLKASWLYNLLLFIRFLVMNCHRFLYLLLSIAVKYYSVRLTLKVLYQTVLLGFNLEMGIVSYMNSIYGYAQMFLLFNLINFIFDVESDFTTIKALFVINRNEQNGGFVPDVDEDDEYQVGVVSFLNRLIGAGRGGKRMISNKTKNKGTGGKSKVKRGPLPPEQPVESEVQVEAMLEESENRYKNFVYSKFPKMRTRFKSNELIANARFVDFDCHGAPFCGVVCVDIAVGIEPNLDNYRTRALACDEPTDLGTNEFLAEYANSRGVNFAFINTANGVNTIHKVINSPNWDYVLLKFNQPADESLVGHWTLMCTNNNNVVTGNRENPLEMLGVNINQQRDLKLSQWLFGLFTLCYSFAITEIVVDLDSVDNRETTNKRDPSEVDDSYLRLNGTYKLIVNGFGMELVFSETPVTSCIRPLMDFFEELDARTVILNGMLPAHFRFDFLFVGGHTIMFVVVRFIMDQVINRVVDQADNFFLMKYKEYMPRRGCLVSFQKFKKAYLEAQTLPVESRMLALSLISQTRYINTNTMLPLILLHTVAFTKAMILGLDCAPADYQIRRVAINAANARSIIANREVIAANQDAGVQAVGAGRSSKHNFVKNAKIRKVVVNRVVAQSPTINFVNSGKQLGPGQICVTDDLGLLAAFCGRSMSKDPTKVNNKSMDEFVKFSKRFIDRVITSMDFSNIKEEDPREAIKRLYKGKKPQNFIDSLVQGYTDYLAGKQGKKYKTPSCFNKMENSAKVSNGQIRTKPRLIMVMSELMLVEYSQVLDVISAWNDSFIKRFQIKHESEEEVIRKVIEVTSKSHMVTDYSSFECSIIGKIREIENYCISKCLRRAGLNIADKRFHKDFAKPRILKNGRMEFYIDSRNSGDFHTSWMNGLVNVLIGAYTYYQNNPDDRQFSNFNMIAEGDDGLRKAFGGDEEVAKKLGFGFSMSTSGNHPGDVDFLRARWIGDKRYLNVARSLKIAWTLSGKAISKTKSKQIQRCAALSLHAISPGHPILWALVKRIMLETKPNVLSEKMRSFIGTNYNHNPLNFDQLKVKCAQRMEEYSCDESMRKYVALGAADFPPISIAQQLALEGMILDRSRNVINLIGILDDYEDVKVYSESEDWQIDPNYSLVLSKEMEELMDLVGAEIMVNVKIFDGAVNAQLYEEKFSV